MEDAGRSVIIMTVMNTMRDYNLVDLENVVTENLLAENSFIVMIQKQLKHRHLFLHASLCDGVFCDRICLHLCLCFV